jgi:hypothetical protein
MGKHSDPNKSDAQERADRLNELLTYVPPKPTGYDKATKDPAPIQPPDERK